MDKFGGCEIINKFDILLYELEEAETQEEIKVVLKKILQILRGCRL